MAEIEQKIEDLEKEFKRMKEALVTIVDVLEKQKVEDLKKEVEHMKDTLEGLVNLKPLPELTRVKPV